MHLRLLLGRIVRHLLGEQHVRVRGLFLSGLGVVYLCAFASLWPQVHGLIGPAGIAPVDPGTAGFPTLLRIDAGDRALDLLCGSGVVLSAAVVLGFLRLPCLVLLWVFYLSLFTAGGPFLRFQWDTLLLESGFLAIFLAPSSATPWGARGHEASALALWAQRYLLFRLMFASGLTKLLWKDASWLDFTALSYHYQTQPLPTGISWDVHHLPMWFHKLTCGATFLVELVVPFLIFVGRIPRLVAFLCIAGLQLTIAVTGNYGFFNLLTFVLSLTLLDDGLLPWAVRPVAAEPLPSWAILARRCALVPVLLLATLEFSAGLRWEPWPRWVEQARAEVDPLRLASRYGLFRVMTKERREIIVEGSRDGQEWLPYVFKYKPGDPLRAPSFVGPHMPRLDWQMWFAALSSFESPRTWWFGPFLRRLLDNEPAVLALLESNPFPDEPPRYIRATVYRYEFTTREERRATGAAWKRTELGPYTPVLFRRPG